MRHPDVTELQNRLTEEGFYNGPVTGYFGRLTRAAVIRYQKAHNITPAVGYFGPITRAAMNADQGANSGAQQSAAASNALTPERRAAIQSQIDALMQMVRDLMERLRNL